MWLLRWRLSWLLRLQVRLLLVLVLGLRRLLPLALAVADAEVAEAVEVALVGVAAALPAVVAAVALASAAQLLLEALLLALEPAALLLLAAELLLAPPVVVAMPGGASHQHTMTQEGAPHAPVALVVRVAPGGAAIERCEDVLCRVSSIQAQRLVDIPLSPGSRPRATSSSPPRAPTVCRSRSPAASRSCSPRRSPDQPHMHRSPTGRTHLAETALPHK